MVRKIDLLTVSRLVIGVSVSRLGGEWETGELVMRYVIHAFTLAVLQRSLDLCRREINSIEMSAFDWHLSVLKTVNKKSN